MNLVLTQCLLCVGNNNFKSNGLSTENKNETQPKKAAIPSQLVQVRSVIISLSFGVVTQQVLSRELKLASFEAKSLFQLTDFQQHSHLYQ